MPRTRSLEIWHIPKRQNVHQLIGAVEILAQESFNGKSWNTMRQENFNTQLGREGLTNSGRPLSPSARRTFEAQLKYLGFIFIDNTTTPSSIHVTNAGFELIKKHGSVLGKRRNLRQVQENNEEILESPMVRHQMTKLQITNPVIREDCINILLFPFRITLALMLEMGQLSKEELGYIVFSMKQEDEYNLIVEKIKTFRLLPQDRREAEIEAFKNTEVGNLTLVQAPTTTYYMGLCIGTGLCKRDGDNLLIREDKTEEVKDVINKFEGVKPFDFSDNLRLWIDYFGNIERLRPPLLVNITLQNKAHVYLRVLNIAGQEVDRGVISEESPQLSIPLFKDETYTFEFYSLATAQKISEHKIKVIEDKLSFDVPVSQEPAVVWDFDSTSKRINDLIVSRDFDPEYSQHINIVRTITGRTNFNTAQLRGGRLEYLFFRLLSVLRERGDIDDVVWNGRPDEFGLAYPALGGKEGYPDLYFFVDKTLYVLELTTIRANAMQWSAEGASVHDHIVNQLQKIHGGYSVVGLFSAPSIAPRVLEMFRHITSNDGTPHIPLTIVELIEILKGGRPSIKNIYDN